MALLAQQLPSLPNYSGDNADADGEGFNEWLERLELVATTCGWDDQAKLVNVATRLRGGRIPVLSLVYTTAASKLLGTDLSTAPAVHAHSYTVGTEQ